MLLSIASKILNLEIVIEKEKKKKKTNIRNDDDISCNTPTKLADNYGKDVDEDSYYDYWYLLKLLICILTRINFRNRTPHNTNIGYDRRGFSEALALYYSLLTFSIISFWFCHTNHWFYMQLICCMSIAYDCFGLVVIYRMAIRPPNNPDAYSKWIQTNPSNKQRCPTLLCIGDSLTQGTVSANYTTEIATQLAYTLGMKEQKSTSNDKLFQEPLYVVNCGQNYLTTHNILKERLKYSITTVQPDYVTILIGSNDVIAMYDDIIFSEIITTINQLPNKVPPTMLIIENNIRNIITTALELTSADVQIGICTIPPMGEDDMYTSVNQLVKNANKIIEKVVSQMNNNNNDNRLSIIPIFAAYESIIDKKKKNETKVGGVQKLVKRDNHLFEKSVPWTFPLHLLYYAFNGYLPRTCTALSGTNVLLMSDNLHLNENGRDVIVKLITNWLQKKDIHTKIVGVSQEEKTEIN